MSQSRGTILVIDDEASVSQVIRRILEGSGFLVRTASNGVEGLEIFSQSPDDFKLVILDVNMPGMKGEEVLKQLSHLKPDVKALICTSLSLREVAVRFGGLKLAGYLAKPFQVTDLVQAAELATATLILSRS